MGKRASTQYSFVVGIDKPAGYTSHDIVNRVRAVYGERRVGHTGTLDPAATGVLLVCVGPATRLDSCLTGHNKSYEFTIVFGTSTDTDDAEGNIVSTAAIPTQLYDEAFASHYVSRMVGPHTQLPPAYSAVKVNGVKSYEAARAGKVIKLEPRTIEVFDARLADIAIEDNVPCWRVAAEVSAGTYVRSLARDTGAALGTCAHVGKLRRVACGRLGIDECVSLDTLEADPFSFLVDPVQLLGYRVVFAKDDIVRAVENGRAFPAADVNVFSYTNASEPLRLCSCTSEVRESCAPLEDKEKVSVVVENKLKAIYEFDSSASMLRSSCGFAQGVQRGADI